MIKHVDKYLIMLANLFVLATSINVALYKISPQFNILSYFIRDRPIRKLFYILAGILALFLIVRKQTMLPFLGECVVPASLFAEKANKLQSNKQVNLTIEAPNADKVIWWAASPEENPEIISNPEKAYQEYENSGVSNVPKDGLVHISFPCPTQYRVPKLGGLLGDQVLQKHLHYREAKDGMLSELKTIKLDC